MEDNSKLFVFEKKEIILIFVFVLIISITAFTLGVRVGKGLSLKEDGFASSDIENIDLKSVEEEYVDDLTSEDEELVEEISEKESVSDIEARLRDEMEKLAQDTKNKAQDDEAIESEPENSAQNYTSSSYDIDQKFKGKYTIQLYSNQSRSSAEDFADPFIIKGYNVIINEAVIIGKGTWYRVSIGLFDSVQEAKAYVAAESKLFQKEDYIIQQL